MSFEDDFVRWQRAATRTVNLRANQTEAFFTDVNVILDELNSLYFSAPVIGRHEDAWPVLCKFSAVIPSNGTNDLLATKHCQLIINLLSRQKVIINQGTCNELLKFLINSLQSCQKWALPDHLKALGAVLYDNGLLCNKFMDVLLSDPPEGLLAAFLQGAGWDIETRCNAVSCLGNICMKTGTGECIAEEHAMRAFHIVLDAIQYRPHSPIDDVNHYRLVLTALRALQVILQIIPAVDKAHQQTVLAALKNCMLCGLPGYKPCFIERNTASTGLELHADDLSSVNLPTLPPKSRSYQNSAAINKRKKKRNIQRKDKGYTQRAASYQHPGPNLRFPVEHSSVDALMPAFAKTSLGGAASKSEPSENKEGQTNGAKTEGTLSASAGTVSSKLGPQPHTDMGVPVEAAVGNDSGSEGMVATSSDSDFSDSEAGQIARIRSMTSKVRQASFGCLQTVIKGIDKKVMFGYWSSFIPDSSTSISSWSLFSTILKDPAPRSRAGGVAVLTDILDGSRQFLAAAEDREGLSPARPFTSFSARLGGMVQELHRCLLQALAAETSIPTKVNLIKCLSVLVLNSPYNRLRPGLLTRVVKQVKPLITTYDVNLRVAVFTCLGMVVSVHAPLAEVRELLTSQVSRPSSGSITEAPHEEPTKPQNAQTSETSSSEPLQENSSAKEEAEDSKTASEEAAAKATRSSSASTDLFALPDTSPWLLKSCVNMVARRQMRDTQPLVVRAEAIQVLTAFVRNYFEVVNLGVPCLTKLGASCLRGEEYTISLFAIKLLEELSKTMNAFLNGDKKYEGIDVTRERIRDFWLDLLQGPLITLLQSNNPREAKLTGTAIDCLSNIGAKVFEILPDDKRITCITMLLGLSNDEDKNIKASAVRAVGVIVLYPCLREDVLYVADTANAVLTCMEDNNLAVRMRAAWSLGNLTDALVANKQAEDSLFVEDFSDMLLLKLLELAITASADHEKVKSNAVRALGNILRYVSPSTLEKRGFSQGVERAVQGLARNIGSGLMKVRWNACYAVGNVFRNTALPLGTATWTNTIYTALENIIRDCKNFKVRINAVLSLSVPQERRCYGDVNQFVSIIETLTRALEATNTLTDFSEFKYRDTLRGQLCNTLCHLLSLIAVEDLVQLTPVLQNNQETLQHFVGEYTTRITNPNDNEDHPDVAEEETQGKLSRNEREQTVLRAIVHIFQEHDSSSSGVSILRKVLEPNKEPEVKHAGVTS